jgi:hypothetical protein
VAERTQPGSNPLTCNIKKLQHGLRSHSFSRTRTPRIANGPMGSGKGRQTLTARLRCSYGADAPRHYELLERGDFRGVAVWNRVLAAIVALVMKKHADKTSLHQAVGKALDARCP